MFNTQLLVAGGNQIYDFWYNSQSLANTPKCQDKTKKYT